ncbi:acetylornithine/succinylornithine aminotransferase [Actinobacteria bacterium IMCC26207]|nr:acetylornithine/succinylornithine aminotransferase [Actinobacteria bacterium IMCC26207]
MTPATTHAQAMGASTELQHCPLMPSYGPPSVQFVRGQGSWLWDLQGKQYLDLLSGLAVTSLGHSHPDVSEALCEQSQKLLHVSNLFGTEHSAPLAQTLDSLLGGGGQVFFANSGAEANEAAIKLARKFGGPGRHVVLSALGSFHGRTLATLHATGQPAKHTAFQPLPEGFRHVEFCDIEQLEAALDDTVAAVLLEAVQGEGGVNPVTVEYFQAVRRLCDEHGVLFMVDEVQTGLGRCGSWFAFQQMQVQPDVVTMAKALGNGVPIGACWARTDVAAAFQPGDHATTFGGQPLAAAAARAVLRVMQEENVPLLAQVAGAQFAQQLQVLPAVVQVRGLGLLLAVELDQDLLGEAAATRAAAQLLDQGVVVNAVTPTAIRLAPSLLISEDEIQQAVSALSAVFAELQAEHEQKATS